MEHIRQIGSSFNSNQAYIVVDVSGYNGELKDHPSIVEHPELFEIADCDLPTNYSYLIYQSN